MIVVGNKVDLEGDRAVSREEGSQLASEFGADFMEVTAKEDYKVKESFLELLRTILLKKNTAGSSSIGSADSRDLFGHGVDHSGDIDVQIVNKGKTGRNTNKVSALAQKRSEAATKKADMTEEKKSSKCLIL